MTDPIQGGTQPSKFPTHNLPTGATVVARVATVAFLALMIINTLDPSLFANNQNLLKGAMIGSLGIGAASKIIASSALKKKEFDTTLEALERLETTSINTKNGLSADETATLDTAMAQFTRVHREDETIKMTKERLQKSGALKYIVSSLAKNPDFLKGMAYAAVPAAMMAMGLPLDDVLTYSGYGLSGAGILELIHQRYKTLSDKEFDTVGSKALYTLAQVATLSFIALMAINTLDPTIFANDQNLLVGLSIAAAGSGALFRIGASGVTSGGLKKTWEDDKARKGLLDDLMYAFVPLALGVAAASGAGLLGNDVIDFSSKALVGAGLATFIHGTVSKKTNIFGRAIDSALTPLHTKKIKPYSY